MTMFVGKTNKHGQIIILLAADAEGPHIEVSWYLAGIWEGGYTSVRPGETDEQAAQRAYGKYACKKNTFSYKRVELV